MKFYLFFLFPVFFLTLSKDSIDWRKNFTLDENDFYQSKNFELKGKVKSVKIYWYNFMNEGKDLSPLDPTIFQANFKGKISIQQFFNPKNLLTKEITFEYSNGKIFSEDDYLYDKNLNLIEIANKKQGFGRRYKYDSQNRRIQKSYYSSLKVSEIHSFYYDIEDPLKVLQTLKPKAKEHFVFFMHYDEANQQIDSKKYLLGSKENYIGEESIKYNNESDFLETLSRGNSNGNHYIFKYKYTYDDNNNIVSAVRDDFEESKNTYLFDKQGNWVLRITSNDRNNLIKVYKREILYYP